MSPRRWESAGWFFGFLGFAAASVGWILAPGAFAYAWLIMLLAWLGWPLGCMGLLLIHALTGGRWGYAIRPQLLAGARTVLLLPPLLIPYAFAAPRLYPWLREEQAIHLANTLYLNGPAFILRGVVYLAVWCGLEAIIARRVHGENPEQSLARVAPAGLIALAITITFASIDAVMSLDPRFASSVFGLVAIAEMGLFALAVCILAAVIGGEARQERLRELGRLLLALTILWAYLDFMQLLIIWQSDLPREASWYVLRWSGQWGYVEALIAGGHFVAPFFILLFSKAQRSAGGMACACALLILGTLLQSFWLVAPAAAANLRAVVAIVAAAVTGVGGFAIAQAVHPPAIGHLTARRRHV
ncbi:MAG: hypothetical protein WBS22_17220 [Methylocystis sp.]